MESPLVNVLSSTRVFPLYSSSVAPESVPLSIIDSNVANFSPTGGFWAFTDAHPQSIDRLADSLPRTLSHFGQWAGQLSIISKDHSETDHNRRYGSVWVSYGSKDVDVGAELVIAQCSATLASVLPSTKVGKIWNANSSSSFEKGLLPAQPPLALYNLKDFDGLPGIILQITSYKCGGYVIGIKTAHVLADAHALMVFMRCWAMASRIDSEISESLLPIFNPEMVYQPKTDERDETLIQKSLSLPQNRFDCWASAEGSPSWAARLTEKPEVVKTKLVLGDKLPWEEASSTMPVDHYRLSFTQGDVDRIYALCLSEANTDSVDTPRISKADAVQAFVFSLILRGRQKLFKENGDETASFNITLGARERVKPPLPYNFIGSPVFLARVHTSALPPPSLFNMAAEIRRTVAAFTPEALVAFLHDMAHEVCPQRIWGAFWGRRNCIVTSWLRLGVYDIDFGSGKPAYVQALMPSVDGLVHLMEVGSTPHIGENWYSNGISVSIYLARDVGEQILADELVQPFL